MLVADAGVVGVVVVAVVVVLVAVVVAVVRSRRRGTPVAGNIAHINVHVLLGYSSVPGNGFKICTIIL